MTSSQFRELNELIERVIPFRYLRKSEREELMGKLVKESFSAGDVVIEKGEQRMDVYLLQGGSVRVVDPDNVPKPVVGNIEAGHYFGEWEPVFNLPRAFRIVADQDIVTYKLPGEYFLELIEKSRPFAQGMGSILRDNQRIFEGFQHFKVTLIQAASEGHISIARLLPLFVALEPALHPGATQPREIDFTALTYAVRRLPENVTRTFAFLLMDELPEAYKEPDRFFPTVQTDARRRDIWEMLPGKNLVLLRIGDSDLVDLVTTLCLYAVEAQKIRRRLLELDSTPVLQSLLERNDAPEGEEAARSLGFDEDEARKLVKIWPDHTLLRLNEIARHREMFTIDVRRQRQNYSNRRMSLWTSQVADATRDLLGLAPSELPPEVGVHIVSSNTHSVTNCLNPWFRANGPKIRAWAKDRNHPDLRVAWKFDDDALYSIARSYFKEEKSAARELEAFALKYGIRRLKDTASTGIEVQLIDMSQLTNAEVDREIGAVGKQNRDIIVNIDYAFGEQAEHIIRNLLMLFGRCVRSVNFLGKAGALLGRRGDVLAPTAFIEQSTDLFQPLPEQPKESIEGLSARLEGNEVHRGPMLTAEGTLLQNRLMLNFYRHIWQTVGIEMEGTHYYRQILESSQLGVIDEEVRLRFFYYVSDKPLETKANLSARLEPHEGVPPLYAITRQILAEIVAEGNIGQENA